MELTKKQFQGEFYMLYSNYTEKLIGLQGILVKKVFDNQKSKSILIEMEKKCINVLVVVPQQT